MSRDPEGLFLCHLVTWTKKFSFCLNSSELGLLSLAPTRILASTTSKPWHHTPSPSPPTCASSLTASTTTHPAALAQHHPHLPSLSSPNSRHRKLSLGPLGSQGLGVPLPGRWPTACCKERQEEKSRQPLGCGKKRTPNNTGCLIAYNYEGKHSFKLASQMWI